MIGSVIAHFDAAVQRLRPAAPVEVNGRFVPGVLTSASVNIAVVPMYGNNALRLPEGHRASDYICFFSQEEWLPVDDDPGDAQQADRVLYNGKVYEIQTCNDWDIQGGFYEIFALRVTQNDDLEVVLFGASEDFDTGNLTTGRIGDVSSFAFTANALTGQFIWFTWPDSLGDPVFAFGGFSGGFVRVDDQTIDAVLYRVYRSLHSSLGLSKILVTRDS